MEISRDLAAHKARAAIQLTEQVKWNAAHSATIEEAIERYGEEDGPIVYYANTLVLAAMVKGAGLA